jgi:hypothetical protein
MAVDLDRLKTILVQSELQKSNPPLYQVIWNLLDVVRAIQNNVITISGGGGGGGGGFANQSYVTVNNDQTILPFSRQIIAGAGLVINNTGQKLILSVAIPIPLDGEDGKNGDIGVPGPQGIQGPQGIPGLDAYFEEIPEPMQFVGNSLHNGNTVTGEYRQVI